MEKFRHIGRCDFEVIEKTEDKINTFYLGQFISQSVLLNFKEEKSFKRTKEWLKENHPELLI